MRIHLLPVLLTVYLLLALQACAMTPRSPSTAELAATGAIPAAEPVLDHYIAWIPRDEAQTATVARALAHTALGSARKQAGDHLCSGIWIGNNNITNVIGPLQGWAPAENGGYAAWYYRISHLPGLRGCPTASDAQVYRAMQALLPEWIHVQSAMAGRTEQRPVETALLE
ncbi:MAG: hypothetical protein WBN57_02220 [Gammaproteobacteria bacterium]